MENQKMTSEQYFALKCEIIRQRNSAEVVLFVFMAVGIVLIAISKAMNYTTVNTVNTTGVVMLMFPFFLFFFLRMKTRGKLDRLHIEYSMGESFYYAAIKLHLMKEKYKDCVNLSSKNS